MMHLKKVINGNTSLVSMSELLSNPETLLEEKIKELNEACRIDIESGFDYNENHFKSAVDPDQVNMSLTIANFMLSPDLIVPWETSDNKSVDLNQPSFIEFARAFEEHKMSKLAKVKILKTKAKSIDKESETFIEKLRSIVW